MCALLGREGEGEALQSACSGAWAAGEESLSAGPHCRHGEARSQQPEQENKIPLLSLCCPSSPGDLPCLECNRWAPSWSNTLPDYGGYSLTTSHHLLLPLSPGHPFGFSYKALLLNKQPAHLSKSMKLSSSPERDILSINHAYYFTI